MLDALNYIRFISLSTIALALVAINIAEAEFTMNFTPIDTNLGGDYWIDTRCNRPEGPNISCSEWGSRDPTPFLQELITVDDVKYYHVIVGLPEDGFAQETFIKTAGAYEGGPSSASKGDGFCRFDGYHFDLDKCNAGDPLGRDNHNSFTGNGSGDPRVVTVRQIMGGTWDTETKKWNCDAGDNLCYEFIKDEYLFKPKIEMTVKDSVKSMEAYFMLDMSNSDYTTNDVAGTLVNKLKFTNPDDDFANFDFDSDSITEETANITGGRYVFTGSGPTSAMNEPYEYIESDFTLDREWWIYKE